MPDRMPEDLPDRMPEDMPEDMPDRMPNRMSEDMSDRMPEDVPVRTCINVMVGITRSKVIFLCKLSSGPDRPDSSIRNSSIPRCSKFGPSVPITARISNQKSKKAWFHWKLGARFNCLSPWWIPGIKHGVLENAPVSSMIFQRYPTLVWGFPSHVWLSKGILHFGDKLPYIPIISRWNGWSNGSLNHH